MTIKNQWTLAMFQITYNQTTHTISMLYTVNAMLIFFMHEYTALQNVKWRIMVVHLCFQDGTWMITV